jgi:hypothetical protein
MEFLQEKLHKAGNEEEILKEEAAELKRKRGENMRNFINKAKNIFSYLYSFVREKFFDWSMSKNNASMRNIKIVIERLEKSIADVETMPEFQAFIQRYTDETHKPYITDPILEKKTKILVQTVNSSLEYALSPEKRSKQDPDKVDFLNKVQELIRRDLHRKPLLKQPLSLPTFDDVIVIDVPQQNGEADCARRALVNARRLAKKHDNAPIVYDEFYKKDLEILKSQSEEQSYLYENSVENIIENNEEYQNIIFIPSIYYLTEGGSFIDLKLTRKLSVFQKKLQSNEDVVQEFVLGDMRQNGSIQNGGHHKNGHYVPFVVKKANGKTECKFANSLSGYSFDHILKLFLKVASQYSFDTVSPEREDELRDFLGYLDFVQVFVDKKLNQDTTRATNDGVMQNSKNLKQLVNSILMAAEGVWAITEGEALWTSSGFKDTKALILDAVDAIKKANGQVITVYPVDCPKEALEVVNLDKGQKKRLKMLKKACNQSELEN